MLNFQLFRTRKLGELISAAGDLIKLLSKGVFNYSELESSVNFGWSCFVRDFPQKVFNYSELESSVNPNPLYLTYSKYFSFQLFRTRKLGELLLLLQNRIPQGTFSTIPNSKAR